MGRKNKQEMMRVEKYSIFLLIIMTLCAFGVQGVHAQDASTGEEEVANTTPDGGIQISPTKFVWTLDDGETKTGRVIVKNYSDIEQNVRMEVEDFYVAQDGSTPQLYIPQTGDPLKAFDVINWFTPPESFTIEPGGVKSVEFTVRVPDGQPTNGYYGSLLFRTGGGADDEGGSKIGLSYRIGALVIMAIQGDAPMLRDGSLVDFYPEKKIFWDNPSILYTKVDNNGNMHYPLFGDIEITRFGKKFHEIEMKPRLLYPNTDPVSWRQVMETGMWDFGYFKAHVAMHAEDDSVQLEGDTTFWVIPWKGLVVIGVGLLVLLLFVIFAKKYIHIGVKPQQNQK